MAECLGFTPKAILGMFFFFFYAKADNVEAPDLASVLLALWPHLLEGSLCVCHHRFTQEPSRNCPWHGLCTTSMQSGSSAAVVVWKHTKFPWHRSFAILGHCRGANLIFICLSCLSWKILNLLLTPPPPISLFIAFGAWEFGVLISSPLVPESHHGASLAFPGHQEALSPNAQHRQEKNKCFQRVSYSYTLSPPSACCIGRPGTWWCWTDSTEVN